MLSSLMVILLTLGLIAGALVLIVGLLLLTGRKFPPESRPGPSHPLPVAWNSQSFGHPDKLNERSCPHFLHDVAAMDDGLFCSLQFVSDLLVEHPQSNTFDYAPLAKR